MSTIVESRGLKMYFPVGRTLGGKPKRLLKAVDDVSFSIQKGETFGLVGESGCGKTTVGRCLVRLYEPTDGQIFFDGQDIAHLGEKPLIPYRRRMQMIFQDPYASLNPRMTVASIIAEPLRYAGASKAYQTERVRELVDLVGLKPDHLQRYPHEFSGGQRQRVGIARALACNPEFIVCDEPISALDVSIQAQVINTLESLQEKLGLSYLFVSHDLSMVRHISHNVGVMYLGCMVERAPVHELYSNMLHPYTQALMSAVPIPDPDIAAASSRIHLSGDVPTPIDPPSGCRFRARCPYATEQCAQERPLFRPDGGAAALHDAGDDREELCFRVVGRGDGVRCAARIGRTEQRGDRPERVLKCFRIVQQAGKGIVIHGSTLPCCGAGRRR